LTVFINAPKASETENVLACYSGHYKHDSPNVQAMADHRGSFIYFAVAAPMGYPDANALSLTRLQPWIDGLHHGLMDCTMDFTSLLIMLTRSVSTH
jgi:hypothetical protein